MCLHPFKGWSWLCSAAEFAFFLFVVFFLQCVPLERLVLTLFPRDVLKELLLTLPFSLNSFDFPF